MGDEDVDTIYVKCGKCNFELTLVVKSDVAERLMALGKHGVACWQCKGMCQMARSGGQA